MEQAAKKTRAPRSEESKQKAREKALAHAAKLREQNGGVAATPEMIEKMKANSGKRGAASSIKRKNGSKATKLVLELLDLINDLHRAKENPEVLQALQVNYPDMAFELNEKVHEVRFSKSSTDIRHEFGAIGLQIWKKVFVCIQQGGYSREEQAGYPSVWSLNTQNWDTFVIKKIALKAKSGPGLTVSSFMDAIADNDELMRVGTHLKCVEINGEKKIEATGKMMTTKPQREKLKERREQLKEKHGLNVKLTHEEQEQIRQEIIQSIQEEKEPA